MSHRIPRVVDNFQGLPRSQLHWTRPSVFPLPPFYPNSFKYSSSLPCIHLQTLLCDVAKITFWSPLLSHTRRWFLPRSASSSSQASRPFLTAPTSPHLAAQPGILCSHQYEPLSSCSWSLSDLGLAGYSQDISLEPR